MTVFYNEGVFWYYTERHAVFYRKDSDYKFTVPLEIVLETGSDYFHVKSDHSTFGSSEFKIARHLIDKSLDHSKSPQVSKLIAYEHEYHWYFSGSKIIIVSPNFTVECLFDELMQSGKYYAQLGDSKFRSKSCETYIYITAQKSDTSGMFHFIHKKHLIASFMEYCKLAKDDPNDNAYEPPKIESNYEQSIFRQMLEVDLQRYSTQDSSLQLDATFKRIMKLLEKLE